MANKTIFELPEQTGKTNNDVLAIVNSGNTTTSKIKVSTLLDGAGQFINGLGTNNVLSNYYPLSAMTSGNTNSLLIGGSGNTISSSTPFVSVIGCQEGSISSNVYQVGPLTMIGSYSSTMSNQLGYASGMFSSYDSAMSNSPYGAVVIGGWQLTFSNPNLWSGFAVGGRNNTTQSGEGGTLGGFNNTAIGQRAVIIGGNASSTNGADSGVFSASNGDATGDNSVIIGGGNITITNCTSSSTLGGANITLSGSNYSVIAGGQYAEITGTSTYSFTAGGQSNRVYNSTNGASVCGASNEVRATSNFSGIFVGQTNTISGATHAAIVGGTNHSNRGNRSVIVGGSGNTITHERSVILGGSGLTSNEAAEVLVQNLKISGQTSGNHFDNASGTTFTIDWNKGNHQTISITGSTTLTFDNTKNGGTYKLQVINTTTGSTLTSITATGYTIKEDGGSISFTNNSTDLLICEVFGTIILVRHFTDFS